MDVVGAVVGIVFLFFAAAGCGSSGGGYVGGGATTNLADGRACTPTQAGSAACTGMSCLSLKTNKQGKAGICTTLCDNAACPNNEVCEMLPGVGSLCAETCKGDNDCHDGFVCVPDGAGNQICFVTM